MGKRSIKFNKKDIEWIKEALEFYLDEEYKKIKVIDEYEFSDEFKEKINTIVGKEL